MRSLRTGDHSIFAIAIYVAAQYIRIIAQPNCKGRIMFSLIRLLALAAPNFFNERAAVFRR